MEYTSKLSMQLPEDGEDADQKVFNSNFVKLDKNAGSFVCESASRPVGDSRFQGQVIYETDTKATYIWTGTEWLYLGGQPPLRTEGVSGNLGTTFAEMAVPARFTLVQPGTYRYEVNWRIIKSQGPGSWKEFSAALFVGENRESSKEVTYPYYNGNSGVDTGEVSATLAGTVVLSAVSTVSVRSRASSLGGTQANGRTPFSLHRIA